MNCNRLFFFLSPYYLLYLLCLVEKPNSLYTKFPLSSPLGHSCCKLNKFFNFLNIRWCWWYLFSWVNYSWGLDWELGEKVSFFFFFGFCYMMMTSSEIEDCFICELMTKTVETITSTSTEKWLITTGFVCVSLRYLFSSNMLYIISVTCGIK